MPRRSQKTKAAAPPLNDWRTTDEDEIARRKQRGLDAKLKFRNLDATHPVYSTFEVQSPSGRTYRVEVRDLAGRVTYCTCPDFRVNGLGTCKHAEALLAQLPRRDKNAYALAKARGSKRIDIVPVNGTDRLRVERGLDRIPQSLAPLFTNEGLLQTEIDALTALEKLRGSSSRTLRISQEVEPWIERLNRERDRVLARREYESQVTRGLAPESETNVPLFPYQREGMLHLAFTERALLADEMGLGKTIQAIAACALLRRMRRATRALIVTPASLKAEWEEQIRRFTSLDTRLVFGLRTTRLRAYAEKAPPFFTIVNYEQVVADSFDINTHLRPEIVILDEAQRIKNWATKTAQAIKRLNSRYAFVLTGTPIENRIDDLFSIMDFLNPEVLGPLFRFNREFYIFDDKGRPEAYQNLERLRERVRPYLLRRCKADVETELPSRSDRNLFVAMTPAQRDDYAAHEAIVAKLVHLAKKRPLTPEQQDKLLRELNIMRMICDTPGILSGREEDCPKLDEIGRILEEALSTPEVKVIVFSEWEHMLERVLEWCKEHKVGAAWHTGRVPQQRRRAEVNAFRSDPACRVFLSTDSGGVGLNLQTASFVINCDLPWNPAKLEQRIARAWRKNQIRSVTVVNVIAENTIEHGMLETLATKRELAAGILDGVGDLGTVKFKRGRDAMLAKLEQVLSAAPSSTQAAVAVPARPTDPAAAFAQELRKKLGDSLLQCDELFMDTNDTAVLMAVVRNNAESAEPVAKQILRDISWPGGQTPTLHIISEQTSRVLNQLSESGLLTVHSRAARPLLDAGCQPSLSEEDQLRIGSWREKAKRRLRAARLLLAEGLEEESCPVLANAAQGLAAMFAIQNHWEEPGAACDCVTPQYAALWGDLAGTAKALLTSASDVPSKDLAFCAEWLEAKLAK